MVKLTVLYNLPPDTDYEAFVKWRTKSHQQKLVKLPSLIETTFYVIQHSREGPAPYRYMSELFFPDQEIFEKAFYDPDFQALLADLKSVAEQQPLDRDIKAFLVAEGVDTQRAQSIENDPRKFYEFIALDESDTNSVPVIKSAVQLLSRLTPVRSDSELQKLEEYIKQSNLKSTGKEFFITITRHSYQLQLLKFATKPLA